MIAALTRETRDPGHGQRRRRTSNSRFHPKDDAEKE